MPQAPKAARFCRDPIARFGGHSFRAPCLWLGDIIFILATGRIELPRLIGRSFTPACLIEQTGLCAKFFQAIDVAFDTLEGFENAIQILRLFNGKIALLGFSGGRDVVSFGIET